MDRKLFILKAVALIILICGLFSCGQVGVITGGEVDNTAPKPILEEITPPMASKNIYPTQIVIPFNEFIALNNPAQNIRVVPDDVTLEPKIKKKSLVLTPIKGEWKDTTTYAVYLKRAVKDITEGNDSLMIYVFSTGNILDSLEASLTVVDAYTNEPVNDITVGLYLEPLIDDTSKVLPRYVAITDNEGLASFKYLKKGPFYAYAFYDQNKNNFLNQQEKRGRAPQPIFGDTVVESIPEIRLMPPLPPEEFKIKSNEVLPPSTWSMSFSKPVNDDSISFDFIGYEPIGYIWNSKRDSINFFFGEIPRSAKFKTAISIGDFQDTIMKKFLFKDPIQYDYSTNLSVGKLLLKDTLTISLNEAIKEVNQENITVKGKKEEDSMYTQLTFELNYPRPDRVQIIHPTNVDSVLINIPPKTINGYNFEQIDTIDVNYIVQQKDKTGSIIVSFDTIPKYGILELLNNKNKVIRAKIMDSISTVEFKSLQPGDYKFRYIIDQNKDGKWSTGDIFNDIEAEEVIWFKDATTVRANWDVKATLNIIPEEDLEENSSVDENPIDQNEDNE